MLKGDAFSTHCFDKPILITIDLANPNTVSTDCLY